MSPLSNKPASGVIGGVVEQLSRTEAVQQSVTEFIVKIGVN
jgi:hypothetical protein